MKENLVNINMVRAPGAKCLEDMLCAAVLLSHREIEQWDLIKQSNEWFNKIGEDCSECKYSDNCLACIINE